MGTGLFVLMLVNGCAVDRSGYGYALPPAADAAIAESAVADARPPDALRDAPLSVRDTGPHDLPDTAVPDAAVPDAPLFDGGAEADVEDASLPDTATADAWEEEDDAFTEPVDAGSDAGDVPDAAPDPDTGPEDAGTDAGPPIGCADDSVEQLYVDGAGELVMAGCDGALDQCTAETLCAPGWHLCSPGEYEMYGGDAASASAPRWLAGCLRRGNCTPTGGSSAICGDCSVESGPLAVLGSACSGGGRVEADVCPVGIAASTGMTRFRLDGDPDCRHADVSRTDALLGATCCR